MQIFNKVTIKISLIVSFVLIFFGFSGSNIALAVATAPSLGAAASFSVLAGLSMSAAGAGTTISGDLGLSPGLEISKTGPWTVGGSQYFGTGGLSATAQANALTAYGNLAGQGSNGGWGVNPWSPAPGVWTVASDETFTGTIYLNGTYDDVWVFQVGNDFTFSGSVVLQGNAQACHVFWQIGNSATIGSGSSFVGTLIAQTTVTVVSGATVNGRILALNGSLTTDGNTITGPTCTAAPAPTCALAASPNPANYGGTSVLTWSSANATSCSASGGSTGWPGAKNTADAWTSGALILGSTYSLTCTGLGGSASCNVAVAVNYPPSTSTITVVKTVINDNGRAKLAADFPLFVNGTAVVNGVPTIFPAGSAYAVTETADANYAQTFSVDCDSSGHLDLVAGDNKVCIITNNDRALASSGGYVASPPVPPLIDVVKVPSPLALPAGPGPVTYTYTLRNVGTVPVSNITMVGDTCSPINLVSGDSNADVKLDVNETWTYSCSTTLSQTHTNTVVATGWANGISAVDIASANVVVGAPVVPPLIHVTKVPSPLALAAGGGTVTYTEKVTNPGTVALSNVSLTDDKCGPMKYISGDTNGNSKLEATETWVYTCRTKLTKTTLNTATASGEANGLTARDFAIATVVVATAVPKLPNTGFAPNNLPWNIMAPAGLFVVLSLLFVARRKRMI